jgi:two-component system, cell cycle sensor histidine kinase and response regulator CckA
MAHAQIATLAAAATHDMGHRQPTVLLVEDEELVRKLLCEALEHEGYTVLACRDADEGLARSRQPGQQIDVLLTDVSLPGMSGTEMVQRMRRNQPQMQVVFMSGCPADSCTAGQVDEPGFLQKPFTLKALMQALSKALENNGGDGG